MPIFDNMNIDYNEKQASTIITKNKNKNKN